MFLIKPKRFFLHITQLLKNNHGGNNKYDANGKLRDHQHFSEMI